MAGRRARPIRSASALESTRASDPETETAIAPLRDAVRDLQAGLTEVVFQQDLVIGTNVVLHGLGREWRWIGITPTVAGASFSWCSNADNPHPDRQVLIDVIGVAQPGAAILVK